MGAAIFLSLLIIVGFGVYALVQRVRADLTARRRALQDVANSHGWRCDLGHGTLHFRLTGVTNDVVWQMVAESDADSSPGTKWWTDDVAYPDLLAFIRTTAGYNMLRGGVGKTALRMLNFMSKTIAAQPIQLLELAQSGQRVPFQSAAVNENFVLIVRPGEGMERIVTSDVERALQAWHDARIEPARAGTFSIDVGQTSLRVYCAWHLKPEHLDRFVNVGVSIASALKGELIRI
jgi:hypothetical protein